MFKWEDIIETKRAMKGFVLNIFDGLADNVDRMKTYANSVFDNIMADIEKAQAEFDKEHNIPTQKMKSGKADARTNWLNSKKGNLKKAKIAEVGVAPPSEILDFYKDFHPYFEEIGTEMERHFSDPTDFVKKMFAGEIDFKVLIQKLLFSVAKIGVTLARKLVLAFLDLLKKLILFAKQLINGTINIPLISWLYKKIAHDDLSLLDASCLLLAIPTTVICKIFEGEAPMKLVDKQNFINSGKTLVQF